MAEWNGVKAALLEATKLALQSGSPIVGTQHLLAGVLHESENRVVRILVDRGVTRHVVEQELRSAFPSGSVVGEWPQNSSSRTIVPLSPKAQQAFDRAVAMSPEPTAGHLLLSLLELENDIAVGLITRVLVDRERQLPSIRALALAVRAALDAPGESAHAQ
jgi:ATP-dependent Clp protease ATP-binding subunit ClpA